MNLTDRANRPDGSRPFQIHLELEAINYPAADAGGLVASRDAYSPDEH